MVSHFIVIYKSGVDVFRPFFFWGNPSLPGEIAYSLLLLNLILAGSAELNRDISEYRQIIFWNTSLWVKLKMNWLFDYNFCLSG
jgi:hypothetical protein